MTILDFLETLEQRDLVPQPIVEQVRAKVEQGDRRITPKSLLKYLVKKEFVTKRQAKQLLETTLTVSPSAESSILGEWSVPQPKAPGSKPSVKQEEDIPTLEPDEEDASESVEYGSLVTDEGSSVSSADLFGEQQKSSLLSESLSAVGGVGEDTTLTEAIEEGNQAPKPKKRSPKKRLKKNEWDSSLLLLGGGSLALLIITGVVVFYLLTRENADAILAEASEFFDGGSYTQAIKQYDRFVENHSKHPEFSEAKVKLGLARLWKASSSSDYAHALTTAQSVLADIEDEEKFSLAHRDLASLLPKTAQGLANKAEQASEPEEIQKLVKQTNLALSLCSNTKYIPKKFRDKVLLNEIDLTLDRVERSRAQNAALAQALTDIQSAIDGGDMAKAYQIHEALIDKHPGLIKNEPLAAKIVEISTAESAAVQYVEESQPASTKPHPSAVVAELALAHRDGPTVEGQDAIVAVRISGAIYGLNASDGSLRWRRHVGIEPRLTPVQLANGDVLVVDAQHNELLRLAGQTGKLVWRQPFDSAVARPVLMGDEVLVAESAGKLHFLNADSGERKGYVEFAQRLSSPPAVGAKKKRIYIAGDHSSLYTLSADDRSCLGVFFLGHAKGSVTTPPAVVLNKVLVAVTKGVSTSRLEVLNTTDAGVPNQHAVSQRLTGLVNTDLLSHGRRLVAVTSRGQVAVFEVGSGTGKDALTSIATREAASGSQVARFGILSNGHVWVAGPKLSKLTILPTSDRLPVSNIDRSFQGDLFDHPLQISGGLLIHVRRPSDQAGAIVAAMDVESGRSQWETALASTPAGAAAADPAGMQIGAVASSGLAYLVNREGMRNRVINRASQVLVNKQMPAFTHSLDLGQGRIVASAKHGDTILHFRPSLPRNALQTIDLVGSISGEPVRWDEDFVVPTRTGQVYLYSSDEAEQQGSPFQPPLSPGDTYEWLPPAVFRDGDNSQLVLSDGKKRIYLLSKAATPHPHLTATENVEVNSSPLNTRFAVVGNVAVAGTEGGSLAVYELPSLASQQSTSIESMVTWGPFTAGEQLLLATADGELICLDSNAAIAWRQPITHGPPTGVPISHAGNIVVLWQQGGISRLSSADGSELAYAQLPQPVVAGPVPFGKRLIVSASDGTLFVVNHPE